MIRSTSYGDVVAHRLSWYRSDLAKIPVFVYSVRGVLIDTGFPGVAREFQTLVRSLGVRGVMITHAHEDHAGNLEWLARQAIPLRMSPETAAMLARPKPIGFYRKFTWRSMTPLTTPAREFHDETFALLPAPGHSTDHHVVWDTETDTLFAGDLFIGVRVKVAHPYENPRELSNSLRALAEQKPARVFCAHRGFLEGGAKSLIAKANWLDEIIARVDERIDAGETDNQIRREILGPLNFVHYFSNGDYSPNNIVKTIRATHALHVLSRE